ncbi:hypothetical protein C1646_757891 [Rhizophagus diaphanus]|nr:hypothetical protein C1646_757891 [Rhizophagus diaphanus] [Rhizophagus sp. MUCL 43196]
MKALLKDLPDSHTGSNIKNAFLLDISNMSLENYLIILIFIYFILFRLWE